MNLSWPFVSSKRPTSNAVYCWVEALPNAMVPEVNNVMVWLWSSNGLSLCSASVPELTYTAEFENQLLQILTPLMAEGKSPTASSQTTLIWLLPAAVDQQMPLTKGLLAEEKLLAIQAQLEERWVFRNDVPAVTCQPNSHRSSQEAANTFETMQVAAIAQQAVKSLTQVAIQLGFAQTKVVWQAPFLWHGIHTATGQHAVGVWLGRFQWMEMGWRDNSLKKADRQWVCAGHPYPKDESALEVTVASSCQTMPAWLLNQHLTIDTSRLLTELSTVKSNTASETTISIIAPEKITCEGNTFIHWIQHAVATQPHLLTQWTLHIPKLLSSVPSNHCRKNSTSWKTWLGWFSVLTLVVLLLAGLTLAWQTDALVRQSQLIDAKQRLLEQAVARHHRELNNRVITTLAKKASITSGMDRATAKQTNAPSTSFVWRGNALWPKPSSVSQNSRALPKRGAHHG